MKNGPWQGSNGVITEGSSPNAANDGVYFKCQYPSMQLCLTTVAELSIVTNQRRTSELSMSSI